MNVLLDTHVALWAITDSPRLPQHARELIAEQAATRVWVSAASVWEIAIKHALGRAGMPVSSKDVLRYFEQSGFLLLAVTAEHALAVEDLPNHHQDPFDRLLVAQALVEPMRLITHDQQVARYNDTIIKV